MVISVVGKEYSGGHEQAGDSTIDLLIWSTEVTVEELRNFDRGTCKMLNIHPNLNIRSFV